MTLKLNDLYTYVLGSADIIDVSRVPVEYREVSLKKTQAEIRKKFQTILDSPELALRFRSILRSLNKPDLEDILYGNHTDPMKPFDLLLNDLAIRSRFRGLDEQNQYFLNDMNAEESYIKAFRVCELMSKFSDEHMGAIAQCAYVLLVLFGKDDPYLSLDSFIKKHAGNNSKPITDVLSFTLPVNNLNRPVHIAEWLKMIMASGFKAIKIFFYSSAIEEYLKRPPKDYNEASHALVKLEYTRADENFELASLCQTYNIDESIFNRCLEIKPKQSDNLPNIVINGADVALTENKNANGYYLVKLPIRDPRAYLLGYITHCCQSIDGDSEKCVIDGITRENNGFYVLLKQTHASSRYPIKDDGNIDYENYEIQGQGYAWLSVDGNLTFDSWENLTSEMDKIIVPMLQKFGKEVTEAHNSIILRVTIGSGGGTPDYFSCYADHVQIPETMVEGYSYGDAKRQYLVYSSKTKIDQCRMELLAELKSMNISIDLDSIDITTKFTIKRIKQLFANDNLAFYKKHLDDSFMEFVELCLKNSSYLKAASILKNAKYFTRSRWSSLLFDPKKTIFLNKVAELYPRLMTRDNLRIIFDISENATDFKGLVWFIDKIQYIVPQIISDANLKILLRTSKIKDSFDMLGEWQPGLLNITNLNFLIKNIGNIYGLSNCLIILYRVDPDLVNDTNRQFLKERAQNADEIHEILETFYHLNSNFIKNGFFKLFIPSDGELLTTVSKLLNHLYKYSNWKLLLTTRNLKLLSHIISTQNQDKLNDIVCILSAMTRNHCMINDVILEKILMSNSHLINYMLTKLEVLSQSCINDVTLKMILDNVYSFDAVFRTLEQLKMQAMTSPFNMVNEVAPVISIFKKPERVHEQQMTSPAHSSLKHK